MKKIDSKVAIDISKNLISKYFDYIPEHNLLYFRYI